MCSKPKKYKKKRQLEEDYPISGPWGDDLDDPWGGGRIG